MPDDLIPRLRALARFEHPDVTLADDAADEIERLRAALVEAQAQLEEERARLDYLNSTDGWVQWTTRDGSIRQCQVWTQNEDEEYLVMSGPDRFFNTERDAIDAARALAIVPSDQAGTTTTSKEAGHG